MKDYLKEPDVNICYIQKIVKMILQFYLTVRKKMTTIEDILKEILDIRSLD